MVLSAPGGAPVDPKEMKLRSRICLLGFGQISGMDQVDYQGFS
jgi:hypothetical protein